MKMLAFNNNAIMNDSFEKGGFSPSRWVLGSLLRRLGEVFDEDEFCDIGVLEEQTDPSSQLFRNYKI
eukprot:5427285-Karenia_brevis.AAC.1